MGFLFQFLIAGLTGIMLSAAPFNWQLSASYFVVAHFHYVIVGAILFAIFGAFYYWFPKMTGRLYNETLGKLSFLALRHRLPPYLRFHAHPWSSRHASSHLHLRAGRGWEIWNLIVTIGVFFQGVAVLIFVANLLYSMFKGRAAGNDPWDAWTLEWSTASPPPEYNFPSIPVVNSRRPLWDIKHPEDPDWQYE